MSLDMTQLDVKAPAEEGVEVTFTHPYTKEPLLDDDGKPYYIKILGGDSGKIAAKLRAISDRRVESIRVEGKKYISSAQTHRDDIETMAAATLSWYLPPFNGVELECTEENALKLYDDPRYPWIMERLEKVMSDRRSFFKKASAT